MPARLLQWTTSGKTRVWEATGGYRVTKKVPWFRGQKESHPYRVTFPGGWHAADFENLHEAKLHCECHAVYARVRHEWRQVKDGYETTDGFYAAVPDTQDGPELLCCRGGVEHVCHYGDPEDGITPETLADMQRGARVHAAMMQVYRVKPDMWQDEGFGDCFVQNVHCFRDYEAAGAERRLALHSP